MVNADNVIYGEALGHTESACSLEGLEIKVSHRLSAMCMWLDSKGQGSFPGWQCTCHMQLLGEISTVPTTPLGEDTQKPHAWSLLDPSHVPVPFVGFSLYPFPVINRHREYSGFSEFCESFQ